AVGSPGPFPIPRAGWRGADWPPAASFTVPEGASGGLYVARVSTAFGTGASGGVGQLGRRAASAPVRDSEVGTTTSTHSGAGGEPSFHLVWATIDIPFIVRSPGPTAASILVSVPDTTYEAYNQWGGRSFYTHSAG